MSAPTTDPAEVAYCLWLVHAELCERCRHALRRGGEAVPGDELCREGATLRGRWERAKTTQTVQRAIKAARLGSHTETEVTR